MNIVNKLHSSITKLIDTAQPADDAHHRKVCLSASQRANLESILAELNELNAKRSDYRFPSKRLSVLTWLHAGPGGSFDDLPESTRLDIEKATFEGNQMAILQQDRLINERVERIGARAKIAIADAHKSLLPCLRAELEKVRSILLPVYSIYGCAAEVEDSGPVRRIERSIADSEQCACGDFHFGADHVPTEFARWI
jgi:hypothetical protein